MKKAIIQPGVIGLDGKEYQVQFDFEAIAEAEDLTDRPILTGLTKRQLNHPTINFVRAMFFAGLRRHHAELTYEEVTQLVNRENMASLWADLIEAWADSRQQETGEDEENPTLAPQGKDPEVL